MNTSKTEPDLYRFVQIIQLDMFPDPFWIGKYPVTNEQYERFISAPDYVDEVHWTEFLKFNEDCVEIGHRGNEGLDWLKAMMSKTRKSLLPR